MILWGQSHIVSRQTRHGAAPVCLDKVRSAYFDERRKPRLPVLQMGLLTFP